MAHRHSTLDAPREKVRLLAICTEGLRAGQDLTWKRRPEIAPQFALARLGRALIVIDFIDMEERKNKRCCSKRC